ncbi:hypothetical protein [Ruegeria sp. HKCCD8929]|uniref:hypothetical protein n=1 Tax=Ruegeria sp. HKCCD8929 TaxID=2683006 RepID=UPI001C2C865B|nr:hypothetical protein [Ruegeria sp. HKCCD8929]
MHPNSQRGANLPKAPARRNGQSLARRPPALIPRLYIQELSCNPELGHAVFLENSLPSLRVLGRAILLFLGVAVALVILFVGFIFVQYQYYYPWKHDRNLRSTKEWNDRHWETGEAAFLTYVIPVETEHGVSALNQQIMCYSKQDARPGNIKEPPIKRTVSYGEGAFWPKIPVSEDLTLEIDFRFICTQALRIADDWHVTDISDESRFVFGDGKYSCFLGRLTADGLDMAAFRILPPEIQALEKVPLRDVVTKATMVPSERYYSPPRRERGKKLYWDSIRSCWAGSTKEACIPDAARVCSTPIE